MKNKKILFALMITTSALAQEQKLNLKTFTTSKINHRYIYHTYSNCVVEYITKLNESTREARSCYQSEPLRLSWTTKTFPLLRENPHRVRYWQGAYAKEIAIDTLFLRELVDDCRGKIISERQIASTEKQTVRYPINNVNLSEDIKESFMLVPMTEQEAREELSEVAQRCKSENIGPS